MILWSLTQKGYYLCLQIHNLSEANWKLSNFKWNLARCSFILASLILISKLIFISRNQYCIGTFHLYVKHCLIALKENIGLAVTNLIQFCHGCLYLIDVKRWVRLSNDLSADFPSFVNEIFL